MSLTQYARFLVIGAAVGIFSVGCRGLIGFALGADNAVRYSISVVTAYAAGILLSFVINGRYTFGGEGTNARWSSLPAFVLVALVGLLSTWCLSLLIRYETGSWIVLGKYSATTAFAIATLLSTGVTYPLNALVVFRSRKPLGLSDIPS